MGLSYMVRMTSIVIAGITFIFLIFNGKQRQSIGFIIGFILVMLSISSMIYIYNITPEPQYGSEISLMFGTNYNSVGGYNTEDADKWFSTNFSKRKSMALDIGINRITENPLRFVDLVMKKFYKLWSDEIFGISWSTELMIMTPVSLLIEKNKDVLYSLSQIYYILILFMTALTCYAMIMVKNDGVELFLMIFLTFILIHSFLEVQSRYHYTMEILFIILSGYSYTNIVSKIN